MEENLQKYPDAVRKELNINPKWELFSGLSFGYEYTLKPENKIQPNRSYLNESAVFLN